MYTRWIPDACKCAPGYIICTLTHSRNHLTQFVCVTAKEMKLPTTDWQTGTQERVRRNEWRECEREWVGQERRRAGSCGATLERWRESKGRSSCLLPAAPPGLFMPMMFQKIFCV